MKTLNKELLENHNTIRLFNYLRNVKRDNFLKDLSDYVSEQTSDLTTQLAKANSDKEKLGKLLKFELEDYIDQNQQQAKLIKQTLQDCGITL